MAVTVGNEGQYKASRKLMYLKQVDKISSMLAQHQLGKFKRIIYVLNSCFNYHTSQKQLQTLMNWTASLTFAVIISFDHFY